jgi:hypothetical protein
MPLKHTAEILRLASTVESGLRSQRERLQDIHDTLRAVVDELDAQDVHDAPARGRPRLETRQDQWRPLAERAEELKRQCPWLTYDQIAGRLGVRPGTLKGWRRRLAECRRQGI